MPTSCVFRRSGNDTLYVRVFIPARLQAVFNGKADIVRSLDTSDQSIAGLRARIVHGRAASLFLHASSKKASSTMDKTKIRILIAKYIDDRLDEWEEATSMSGLDNAVNGDWQDGISAFAQSTVDESTVALRSLRSTASDEAVKDFMERYKLTDIAMGSPAYRLLCRELTKAEKVIQGKIKERAQGEYGSEYGEPLDSPVMNRQHGLTDEPTADPGPPLSEVIPAYLKHQEHRAPGTIEAKRNVLKRFAEIVGDKPVSMILKADCVMYRDTLRKLPANVSKRFPGLSLREAIEKAKRLPESMMLSKATINQDLTHLGHFFSWLVNEGKYTTANPALGLQYEGIESEKHEEFTDAHLKVIFENKEYQAQRDRKPVRFWLPVILAYTGARRDEIADLALSDIGEDSGIHYFDLKPDAARGRRLKNKASKRRVPIHSYLIRLGLLKYIEVRRGKGHKLVFGEGHGDPVSKWFSRLLKKVKIEGKNLHGLRSTVNTKLHECGCDPETRCGLLGHGGVDVNETVYLRLSVKTLREGLEKMRYTF